MIFNYNNQKEVVALLGAGSMGMAIVERVAQNRPGQRSREAFLPQSCKTISRENIFLRRSGHPGRRMVVSCRPVEKRKRS